ncbi:MAG: hypothetical protein LBT78_10160 [Tannerella sp.]|nr:hypothetical protein [Tannerella sp.]
MDESGNGSYYVQYACHWGYADNHPNTDNRSGFNIEWAVDANGNRVHLSGIHFVKVYTGVNQYCGWIGETSTEILGAEDLHLTGRDADVPVFVQGIALSHTSLALTPNQDAVATLAAVLTPAETHGWTTLPNQEKRRISDTHHRICAQIISPYFLRSSFELNFDAVVLFFYLSLRKSHFYPVILQQNNIKL